MLTHIDRILRYQTVYLTVAQLVHKLLDRIKPYELELPCLPCSLQSPEHTERHRLVRKTATLHERKEEGRVWCLDRLFTFLEVLTRVPFTPVHLSSKTICCQSFTTLTRPSQHLQLPFVKFDTLRFLNQQRKQHIPTLGLRAQIPHASKTTRLCQMWPKVLSFLMSYAPKSHLISILWCEQKVKSML